MELFKKIPELRTTSNEALFYECIGTDFIVKILKQSLSCSIIIFV